jgi:hypothetical protein
MLAALRFLGGYLEVRTGRVVAYRYFARSARLAQDSLLLPESADEPGLVMRGTIVRLVVPKHLPTS